MQIHVWETLTDNYSISYFTNDVRFLNQKTKFEQTFLNCGFGEYNTILLFSVLAPRVFRFLENDISNSKRPFSLGNSYLLSEQNLLHLFQFFFYFAWNFNLFVTKVEEKILSIAKNRHYPKWISLAFRSLIFIIKVRSMWKPLSL